MLSMTETAIAALLKEKEARRIDRLPFRPFAPIPEVLEVEPQRDSATVPAESLPEAA